MKILAIHEDRGQMTFDNIGFFNVAKQSDNKWQLLSDAVEMPAELDVIQIIPSDIPELIEVISEHDIPELTEIFDTSLITPKDFKAKLNDWTKEELELFSKDRRKSIYIIAEMQLKKIGK